MSENPEAAMALNLVAHDLAAELVTSRRLLQAAQQSGASADWDAVLRFKPFWSLANDPVFGGVAHMSQEEIQQTLVEDLLKVELERVRGAAATYTIGQALRHLGVPHSRKTRKCALRVEDAIIAAVESGLVLMVDGSDRLSLALDRLDEAQHYAGVFMDFAGTSLDQVDFVDAMMESGGPELLGDALSDLLAEANSLAQ